MKKNVVLKAVFVLLFCLSFSGMMNAQLFSKDDRVINVGIGVPSYLGGSGYETRIPLISGSFDYGLLDDLLDGKASIGVGGYLAYTANRLRYIDGGYDYSYLLIGPRGDFHYNPVEKLDAYAGLLLGYNIVGSSAYGGAINKPTDNNSRLIPALYIGARYYFLDDIAVFGEIGYGISVIELGLSVKF